MLSAKLAAFCLLFGADAALTETETCVFNGGQAVSDMMDAGVYVWAASQRCGKGKAYAAKCAVDVAQAVESANQMVNFILRTINKCGSLDTTNPPCGIAAGRLTARFAGLGAASAAIVQECRASGPAPPPPPAAPASPCATQAPPRLLESAITQGLAPSIDSLREQGESVAEAYKNLQGGGLQTLCFVDVKDSVAQVFQAAAAITAAKEDCPEGQEVCAYKSLGVVEALAAIAKYLMGAVGHCSPPNSKLPETFPLACSRAITKFIKESTGFAAAATEMSLKCAPQPPPPPAAPPATTTLGPLIDTKEVEEPVFPGTNTRAGDNRVVGENFNRVGDGKPPSATPPRLYGEAIVQAAQRVQKTQTQSTSSGTLNMALAALLPITAIVAFAGGMRLRTARGLQQTSYALQGASEDIE